MSKTPSFYCGGGGLIPGWGAKILHASQPKNQLINFKSSHTLKKKEKKVKLSRERRRKGKEESIPPSL